MENQAPKKTSVVVGEVESLTKIPATLGESPIWLPKEKVLYWIDILEKKFFIYNPATKENKEYQFDQMIGSCAPATDGTVILALEDGVYNYNLKDGTLKLIVNPEENLPDNTFNDGKCDKQGRFWVGSMHKTDWKTQKTAGLYRIDKDGKYTQLIDDNYLSNGLDWSLDDKTFYHIDSVRADLRAFDYDAENGTISNPRVTVQFPKEGGMPDGCTLDSEGKLWVAFFGGGALRRYDPDTGELLEEIKLPVKEITSACFGGEDMQTLFITAARFDAKEREETADLGGLFAVRTTVKGSEKVYYDKQF